jgi:hypothetical protein
MHLSTRSSRLRALVLLPLVAVAVSACAVDSPVGPFSPTTTEVEPAAPRPLPTDIVAAPAPSGPVFLQAAASVDVGSCTDIAAPAGTRQSLHTFAKGVQVYRWTGTSWAFVAPIATLYADANLMGKVGTHYAGPTWESNSGSTVKAALITPCPVGGGNIPWLLLGATASAGPGPFEGTTHIQRVNTVGGVAPAEPGTVIGEERHVPYSAEYYFYRAK